MSIAQFRTVAKAMTIMAALTGMGNAVAADPLRVGVLIPGSKSDKGWMESGYDGLTAAQTELGPKLKTQVIGVSKDSVARHDRFKKKYELNFPLVSDEDGKICEKYGTWIEKSLYGRKYMGIDRSTFLIDREGVVREVWRKVKVPGHVEAVLEAAKML